MEFKTIMEFKTMTTISPAEAAFFRIDRFLVPRRSRAEFLERIEATHQVLRRQDGFVRDYVLETTAAPDASAILTFVEWTSEAVVPKVSAAVAAYHRSIGFNRDATIARLGVIPEIASYRPIVMANV